MIGRIFCLAAFLLFIAAHPVYAQFANKTGNVVGAVGGACDSSAYDYGWPDTNGHIIKCVSSVWTAVSGGTASAGGSNSQVQYNSSGVLAGSSNFVFTGTNVGIGATAPITPLNIDQSINTDTAGYIAYQGDGGTTFYVFPASMVTVHNTKNNVGYSNTEGALNWVDEPSSDTDGSQYSIGEEGLLTIETPISTSNYGGVGVDGEAYATGFTSESGAALIGVEGFAELHNGSTLNGTVIGGEFVAGALPTSTTTSGMDGIDAYTSLDGGAVSGGLNGVYIEPDIWSGTVDTRTGIFIAQGAGSPTSGDWGIYDESAAANYFAGNIGIGSASPANTLDVSGEVSIHNGVDPLTGNVVNISGWSGSSELLGFWNSAGPSYFISMGFYPGNWAVFGFGGSNPNPNNWSPYLLSINDSTGAVGIGTVVAASSLSVAANAAIGWDYAGAYSAPTNGMLVEGNVGIGTTNPQATLHVASPNATVAYFQSTGSADSVIQLGALTIDANAGDMYIANAIHILSNGDVDFDSADAVGVVNILDIDYGGGGDMDIVNVDGDNNHRIGMWESSYGNGAYLMVQSGAAISTGTNVNGGDLYMASGESTGTGGSNIWFQTPTPTASGTTFNSVSSKMVITGAGNVGIGTTSPGATFTVGNNNFEVTSAGAVTAKGLTSSGTTTLSGLTTKGPVCTTAAGVLSAPGATCSTSDVRLKKDIAPLENSLDKISRLRGVSYHWKDPKMGKGLEIGLIAQEVEQVFPEIVGTDGEGWKNLNYERLVSPLIESVKELKADNDNLAANHAADAAAIDDLRREVADLKRAIGRQ